MALVSRSAAPWRIFLGMLEQGTGFAAEKSTIGPGMLGLWYDPDRLVIEGVYQDELAAYRARRRWIEALQENFLLEDTHDFSLKVKQSRGGRSFRVRCDFLTACGRYAFWRLTHHQAPEVQFLLETAHLPHTIPAYGAGFLADDDDCHDFVCEERAPIIGRDSCEQSTTTMLQRVTRRLRGLAHRISSLTK